VIFNDIAWTVAVTIGHRYWFWLIPIAPALVIEVVRWRRRGKVRDIASLSSVKPHGLPK
jgi:hypothetical protein